MQPPPENESDLLRSDKDGVATLTLNRPAARNALSQALMEALLAELDATARDASTRPPSRELIM